MSEKIVYDIDVNVNKVDKASTSIDNLGKNAEKTVGGLEGKISGIGEKFGSLPGPVGEAANSFSGLGKQMLQLIKNPIVLVITGLVVAFKTLYEALQSTEEGQAKLNKITALFKAIISPVVKVVQDFAIFLADKFIGVLEEVSSWFGIAGDQASALADNIKQVEEAEGDLAIKRAKQNKDLAEAKEILNDTNKSLKERKDALKKVQDSETALAAETLRIAKQKKANIEAEIKRDGESKDLKDKLDEATINILNSETDLANKRRDFAKEGKKLDSEESARIKQKQQEASQRAKEKKAALDQEIKDREEQAKKIQSLEDEIRLNAITNETEKAIEALKIQKRKDIDEVNNSKATAEEKAKEISLIEKKYRQLGQKTLEEARAKQKADTEADINKSRADIDAENKKFEDDLNRKYDFKKLKAAKDIDDEKEYNDKIVSLEVERLNETLKLRRKLGVDILDIQQKLAEYNRQEHIKQIEEEKKLADAKKANLQNNLDVTKQIFGNIQGLLKENSKGATALAIGQAVIDTYVAANKALASAPPPLNFLLMGSVIATGIANIKKISEQASKMGVDTGATSGASTGPSIGIVGGQVDSGTQVAKSVQGAIGGPQRSYVVGNDVTSRQSLDRRISQNATLGG